MAKVIIRPYTDEEKSVTGTDGACVVIPAPNFLATLPKEWSEEEKLIYVANKDIPTGTPYEIVEDGYVSDRTFRNAWEYTTGGAQKTSADLSLEDQLKYNKITKEEYDALNG